MNLESIKFCFVLTEFLTFFLNIFTIEIKINQGNRQRVTKPLYHHGDNEVTMIT